jgi:hypothetical protein
MVWLFVKSRWSDIWMVIMAKTDQLSNLDNFGQMVMLLG